MARDMYRYMIYGRVSTTGQRDNTSIPLQERASQEFAEGLDWHYVGTVVDHDSGAKFERDGVDEVLATIRDRKADVVVFYKVNRVARTQAVFEQFFRGVYDAGGMVAIADKNKLYDNLLSLMKDTLLDRAFAEHEWLDIREKTSLGKVDHIKRGSFVLRPIFGYEVQMVRDENGRKFNRPIIRQDQATTVEYVFDLFLSGLSRLHITRRMNAEGVPTISSKGKMWRTSSITRILKRAERYAGMEWEYVEHNQQTDRTTRTRYQYPPIIAPSVADTVQRSLTIEPRRTGMPYPLRGVVRCACGRPAVRRQGKRNVKGERYHLFQCVTTNVERKRETEGVHGDLTPCRYSATHVSLLPLVEQFLDGPIMHEMARLGDRYVQTVAAADEVAACEDELLDRRRRLLERVLEVSGEEFGELRREFLRELQDVNIALDIVSKEVLGLQRRVDQIRRVLTRLDILGGTVLSQYETVRAKVQAAREAMGSESWSRMNAELYDLGVRVEVEFAKRSPVVGGDRPEPVVSVDHGFLLG
jgi:DNA invertase Pin-like site-specific DNA recombinase